MERELLLLGIVREQPMSGYQLNEVIEAHVGTVLQLKRPTVYKLLNQMSDDGWLRFSEEQEGSRPTKRVYSITEAGERVFRDLLRQSLADYQPVESPSQLAIAYLDVLTPAECVPLLRQRRDKMVAALEHLRSYPDHPGSMQLIVGHQIHHLESEIDWLDQVIDGLNGQA